MDLTRIAWILMLLTSALFESPVTAQNNSPVSAPKGLYAEIFGVDSSTFAALNAHNVNQLMSYFTKDVEFYNDGGGLTTYEQTAINFASMFKGTPGIRRELVNGSLEVYPLKDYGAIATGAHRFCHPEQGKEVCGSYKFTTIWRQEEGGWKMARVVSYGH